MPRGPASPRRLARARWLCIRLGAYVRFAPYAKGYGITPAIESTYRKACKEGWAPQPTNEYQQAIWDSFHELPTKPVKIEFDPAKGK